MYPWPSLEHAAHESPRRYQRHARFFLARHGGLRVKGFCPSRNQAIKATADGGYNAIGDVGDGGGASHASGGERGDQKAGTGHGDSPVGDAVATGGGPLPLRGNQEGRRSPVS